jgi:hypothetical protein
MARPTAPTGKKSAPRFRPRVVVKLRDGVEVPYVDGLERRLGAEGLAPMDRFLDAFPGSTFRRLFSALPTDEIEKLIGRAVELDRSYRPGDFFRWFVVDGFRTATASEVARELQQWDIVEQAFPDRPALDPVVNAADDPRSPNQGYLTAAPAGVDAAFAWGIAGGDGAGINVIDLEQGWTLNHEDLVGHGATLLFGTLVNSSRPHGTSVLGEICAVDNALGCVGVTPNVASVDVVSHSGSIANVSNGILAAIPNLAFGDVLLLEVQVGNPPLPIETDAPSFNAIRLATALGIVVVEAGGNGSNDLDAYTSGGLQVLNRGSADFQDSGAIMVGAGSSTVPHTRLGFSNFGSRIDCYGWGENVDTSTSTSAGATTLYTGTFNGTSSASPIVTGAAIAVQGMAQATLGFRLSPRQVRRVLSDPATGTASNNPLADRIGVMPNLRPIAQNVLGVAPDVYLRDFVGDTGDPHAGAISASPDVILLKAAVANPQAAFGAGSGTENSNTLGEEAEAGQDNFVYVRALNRGGSDAPNVVADVFWAPPATLVTPNLWTSVGSVTIPSVPSGNVLTVSDAITWPSSQIPATGHYCFVCLLGTADDPAPSPGALLNWTNFTNFIRNNNNVTWRNFNVVDLNPSAGDPGLVLLPFLAVGAPDEPRRFRLEVVGRLPQGARLAVEASPHFLDAVGERSAYASLDKTRKRVRVPVNPHGRTVIADGVFPVGGAMPMRLVVALPKALRRNAYEVYVRQVFEELEVGRVTWRLAPRVAERPPRPSVRGRGRKRRR